jgi:hypothetical protein
MCTRAKVAVLCGMGKIADVLICSVSPSVFHSCFYWLFLFKLFIPTMLICSMHIFLHFRCLFCFHIR